MAVYKRKIAIRQAVLARYRNGDHTIKIVFPFDPDDVALVKTLPGRKYNGEGRFWTCPPTKRAVTMLKDWAFVVDRKLLAYVEDSNKYNVITSIPGLHGKLYPFQMRGVEFLQGRNGKALIGDEQGLGKTAQSLAYLQLNPKKRPVVIVVPASVKLNWVKEIRMWMTHFGLVQTLSGRTPHRISGDIVIINYDIVEAWVKTLIDYGAQVLILDEVQYLKSSKTKRTTAVRKLAKHIPHLIGLSGTPIMNRPVEFFNIIRMIDATLFPNWLHYTQRYCDRKHNGFGWVVTGASNTEELHEILVSTIFLRRTKAEVLPDLPDKIHSFFPLEMHPDLLSEYEKSITSPSAKV